MAISYVDYSSMEFLIGAAKSRDPLMLKFYENDPYLSFAKHVGAAPSWATKHTHGALRDRYKTGLLAIQYGVACVTLAAKLGVSQVAAQAMIDQHHELFFDLLGMGRGLARLGARPRDYVDLHGLAMCGRRRRTENPHHHQLAGSIARRRHLANGLHLGDQRGLKLCAPVHDAILLESTIDRIDRDVALLRDIMARRLRSCSAARRCAPTRRSSAIPTITLIAAATRSGDTSPGCLSGWKRGRGERAEEKHYATMTQAELDRGGRRAGGGISKAAAATKRPRKRRRDRDMSAAHGGFSPTFALEP